MSSPYVTNLHSSYAGLDNISNVQRSATYYNNDQSRNTVYSNIAPQPSCYEESIPTGLDAIHSQPDYEETTPPTTKPKYSWPPLHTAPKFSQKVEREEVKSQDFSRFFTKGLTFGKRKDAIDWVKSEAKKLTFCMINERKESGAYGKTPCTWLICERGGPRTPSKDVKGLVNRPSKKCGCQFQIKVLEYKPNEWSILVTRPYHNHAFAKDLEGHPIAGKLTPEEMMEVDRLYKKNTKAATILSVVNEDEDNCTGQKQIYNAIQKLKKKGMQSRTVVQEFFHRCKELGYFLEYMSDPETNKVTHMFFAHPDSIRLLRAYPYVLLIDSTYATNM